MWAHLSCRQRIWSKLCRTWRMQHQEMQQCGKKLPPCLRKFRMFHYWRKLQVWNWKIKEPWPKKTLKIYTYNVCLWIITMHGGEFLLLCPCFVILGILTECKGNKARVIKRMIVFEQLEHYIPLSFIRIVLSKRVHIISLSLFIYTEFMQLVLRSNLKLIWLLFLEVV